LASASDIASDLHFGETGHLGFDSGSALKSVTGLTLSPVATSDFSGMPQAGNGVPGNNVCQSHFRSGSGLQGRPIIAQVWAKITKRARARRCRQGADKSTS